MSPESRENIPSEFLELPAENMVYVRNLGWVKWLQWWNLVKRTDKETVLIEQRCVVVIFCWLLLNWSINASMDHGDVHACMELHPQRAVLTHGKAAQSATLFVSTIQLINSTAFC